MWYLGIGSIRHLPGATRNLIYDLSECLARSGYSLRTGGRGEVDDAFWLGAGNIPRTPKSMILPVNHFRHYSYGEHPDIRSWKGLPPEIHSAAARECALPASKRRYYGNLKRAMDDVCVPLVMGPDLKTPVRFAVTYAPGERHDTSAVQDIGASSDPIFSTPDAAAFYLLKKMQIEVFNLANPEHTRRIVGYINSQRYEVV